MNTFRRIRYFVGFHFYRVRDTQWRRYFAKNGERTWVDDYVRFTGWRETQNELAVAAHWTGVTNTGDHYYTSTRVELQDLNFYQFADSRQRMLHAKAQNARAALETFLNPECRCRAGYHWKCKIHHRWMS